MAATNINLSVAVNSIPVVAVAIATISMSVSYSQPVFGVADVGSSVQIEASIQPTIPLANDFIRPSDDDLKAVSKTLTTTAEESNDVFVTDSDPLKNIQLVKTDSVTAVESRVKVFTDFIDFDPSDDDVDATPVTISESDAKDITVGELADNDEATVSESIANNPSLPKTDSVSASEAINQFRPNKNVTDTATTSEAIDRFNVTTALTDTVSVTEATVKSFTVADPNDSVTAVQSNVKAFTSNIDFDLSDADVDPDPVVASEQINTFALNKGLTDTSSVSEATAKNFTHGGLSDTASAVEATAFSVTVPGFADSLTAVEGIKLNPSIPVSDTVSPAEAAVLNVQKAFSHAATVTESINTLLTLGESSFLYPNRVYAFDSDSKPSSIRGYHRGLGETGVSFVQDVFRFDSDKRDDFVGVIGSAGLINQPRVNGDTITYAETSSAGLLVNFIYTDTDDTELGGHFLNETPLCAGRHT